MGWKWGDGNAAPSANMTMIRTVRLSLILPLAASPLAGCSLSGRDDPDSWYNKTVAENIAGRSAAPPTETGGVVLAPSVAAAAGVPAVPAAPRVPAVPAAPRVPATPGAAGREQFVGGVSVAELYRSDGSCGGMMLGPGGERMRPPPGPVSLDMTECEVARRSGPPDKVEISSGTGGERMLTLSYLQGQHPRIYHFTSGRLAAIENVQGKSQKRAKT